MFHRIGKDGKRYWGKQGAGILYTDGTQVLLLKRKRPSDHPATWSVPGGRAEEGETAIDAAMRETEEETGVKVHGTRFAAFEEIDGRFRYTCFLYAIDTPFECDISKEHDRWKWIPLNDLDRYELHPNLEKSLPYYKKAILRRFPPKKFTEWLDNCHS